MKRHRAFTLVELLIVIGIIATLISIAIPSINKAIYIGYTAKSGARIGELRTSLVMYHRNEGYYPGQRDEGSLYPTGSTLLARAMFTNEFGNFPRSGYMEYSDKWLAEIGGIPNTISDGFRDSMAICYYFSNGNGKPLDGPNRQYWYSDNDEYTDDAGGSEEDFEDAITDTRYDDDSTTPYGDGGFIIIAPGIDREYFTEYDKMGW